MQDPPEHGIAAEEQDPWLLGDVDGPPGSRWLLPLSPRGKL